MKNILSKKKWIIFCVCLLLVLSPLVAMASSSLDIFKREYAALDEKEVSEKLSKYSFEELCTEINILNDSYYGFKSVASNYGLNDEFVLIDSQSKEIKLKYPENLTDWFVGSGSSVVLQNRYLYEWHSYNSEVAENTSHDVKLTRIDGKSGNVELVDEIESGTPLIYMCKISDSEFLSYSITKAPSDRTEYAVISAAWVYTEKGEKREIINEKYENNANWTDSEGILIECFAVRDGKILGLGRRLISGKYQFFLYHYDNNGKMLSEEVLIGLENIIGSEQFMELYFAGNYFAFRTYESLSTYICKVTDNGVELIMKGADAQVPYAVTKDYMFFIEKNVNVYNGEIKEGNYPLYIIDIQKEEIYATNFSPPLSKPYFVGIQSLANDSLLVQYCDNGSYDPQKTKQYILDKETIADEISHISKTTIGNIKIT